MNIAVGGNSGLVIAQQRLQKAQELIVQVNAQGRPQFSADAVDTYSSYRAFAPTLTNPVITNPTLPGGGQIPQVVDSGTGFSTAFIGGGGGGNAPSTGASSSVGLSASHFRVSAPAGQAAPEFLHRAQTRQARTHRALVPPPAPARPLSARRR